ncbi:hypothetical protein BKA01_003636 [Pseudonocardia eucalypti]|nr:hypothetical protein [Pseudonocardia eucalypti]
MTAVIQASGLVKTFGHTRALDGLAGFGLAGLRRRDLG